MQRVFLATERYLHWSECRKFRYQNVTKCLTKSPFSPFLQSALKPTPYQQLSHTMT